MVGLRQKTVALTEDGLRCIPINKTAVYMIKDTHGEVLYAGIAKRGSVLAGLRVHLPGGSHPIDGGVTVQTHQKKTLASALRTESKIIAKDTPRYNGIAKV